MKLKNFINQQKSFSNLARQSLEVLSDSTPLQLRHRLKEGWDAWVDMLRENNLYDDADAIISKKYSINIEHISKIKPSVIKIMKDSNNEDIEQTHIELTSILKEHENLTLNALLWATICSAGSKMRFDQYLKVQNYDCSQNILEIFLMIHQDEILNEEFDLNKILQKIGFTFKKERGLIQILTSAGKQTFSLFKALFIAWYTGEEEDKEDVKKVIEDSKITKEHIIDVLFKLDEITLHLLTGPLYILSAITGWEIRPKAPGKRELVPSTESKIKDAIQSLTSVVGELPKKFAKTFKSYLKGLSNLVCRDLHLCTEDKKNIGGKNEN